MAKVLIADDDVGLCTTIKGWLSLDHHNVEIVHDGEDALARLKVYDYDLIILDIGMPGLSGFEVLTSYRSNGGVSPVLFLTGKNTIEDVERGFAAGADDYLRKPFHGKELTARVKALLRRPQSLVGNVLGFGALSLDRENYRVTKDGAELQLLPKEFALLEFFMRHPNRVFAPEALLNRVWTAESEATVDAVTTCIKRLRQKIDDEGKQSYIRTVRGAGYRLEEID
ncbi:MAG TPA: response regulator transcription factor [Planktothrix sp.]|jgi:two-component system OmpR family response regulator